MHQLFSNHDIGDNSGGLRDITRSLRQFCLLREMGADVQAIELQSQKLDELITAYRAAHGPDTLPDERIRVLLLDEQERVASAAALSEMVAPLLAQRLQVASPAAPRARRAPLPRGVDHRPADRPAGAPAIADLIDGMLAQDLDALTNVKRRTG